MKKQLIIVGIASVLCAHFVQAGGAVTELRTKVENKTKGDTWVTWKSATTIGKAGSTVTHVGGVKSYRYLQIPAGKNYTMAHTGDKIEVFAYPCVGKYVKLSAKSKGYKGMSVEGTNGNITITEMPGSTQGGSVTELRTEVYNKTDGDIWVTWKSASVAGKIVTTPFHWMREHRFVRIPQGKSYTMMHTGDKISVYYYSCSAMPNSKSNFEWNDDKAASAQFSPTKKGYKRMTIKPAGSTVTIEEA